MYVTFLIRLGVTHSQEPFTKLRMKTGIHAICLTIGKAEDGIIVKNITTYFILQTAISIITIGDQYQ